MKKIVAIIVIVIALIGVFYASTGNQAYEASIMPLSFEYPKGYIVEEKVDTITIMREEDYQSLQRGEREGGEGPPVISIRVIDNPNNPGPRDWAEQYPPQSNYNLRTSDVTGTTVAGYPAINYSADGLYPNRNVIFATDSRLYYINGSYLTQDSALYRDFPAIVESIRLK